MQEEKTVPIDTSGESVEIELKEDEKKKARISWSQFSMYRTCPHRWELNYAKKLRKFIPSIHLIFGTAMHEV
ncbi:MAG TPA: hypothetical protein DF712_15080, partial [Balneola sp.]|nr:hypothetical protein [Balneola sp.]